MGLPCLGLIRRTLMISSLINTVFRFNPRLENPTHLRFWILEPFWGHGWGNGMRGGMRFSNSMFGDDLFGSAFSGMRESPMESLLPPIENKLPCTLEELYKGTTKKMKISREIADISGLKARSYDRKSKRMIEILDNYYAQQRIQCHLI